MGSTNGVSRGQLRPYFSGRMPPFLLVGLVLIMAILGWSYWSLNTQYTDLQSELQKLEERLRIYAEKRESFEKQNSALQTQLQQSQNEEGKYKIALDKKQQEVNHLSEQLRNREEDVKSNVEKCETLVLEKKTDIDHLHDKIKILSVEKSQLELKLKELELAKKSLQDKLSGAPYVQKLQPRKNEVSNKGEDTTISQSNMREPKIESNLGSKVEISADPDVGPPPDNREVRALKTTTKMPVYKEIIENDNKMNPSIKVEDPKLQSNAI